MSLEYGLSSTMIPLGKQRHEKAVLDTEASVAMVPFNIGALMVITLGEVTCVEQIPVDYCHTAGPYPYVQD